MRSHRSMGRIFALTGVWLASAVGCTYHGALYAEYGQVGLGVRAAPEQGSPADVHFGWDRGVFAWVPKRDPANEAGEGGSIISRNLIGANLGGLVPAAGNRDPEPLLEVDAAFISGTAAVVASVPDNTKVVVRDADGPFDLVTDGSAGARIAAAFEPTLRFPTVEISELHALLGRVYERDDHETYAEIIDSLSPDARVKFDQRLADDESPRLAFKRTKDWYLLEEFGEGPRHNRLIAALRGALEED